MRRARQVEHDRLAQSGAVQAPQRVERRQPGELRVGRQRAAVAQVDAQHQAGNLLEQPVESAGGGAAQRLGPDAAPGRAAVEQRPRRGRRADARVDPHARLARQRGDRGAVVAGAGDRVEVGDV